MSMTYDVQKSDLRNIAIALLRQTNNQTVSLDNVLFVDGGRVESYTADGSLPKPYKTITAANAAAVSGDVIIVAPGAYAEVQAITTGAHLFGWNVTGATLTGENILFLGTTLDFTGNLVMENDAVISNAVNGTIAMTGALDVSSTLVIGGDLTLESANTITNAGATAIITDAGVTVGGIITLENAETIDNSVNGTIALTATDTTISSTLGVGGDIILENDETISNAVDGQVEIDGNLLLDMGTTGGLKLMGTEAASTAMAGATHDIEVNIPSGALILASQLRVDTLITSDTGATWSAAFIDGSTASLGSGLAFAKQTKTNSFFNVFAATNVASAETDIQLSPNAGSFTAGVVRAIVYYMDFETMADAA